MRLFDGEARLLEGVPAVDASQRVVVSTLHTVFHDEEATLVQVFEIVEERVGHAVRARADDDTHNIFHLQGLFIELAETVDGGIGVGISLEVGQILHLGVFPRKELLASLQLTGDAVLALTVGRIEGAVVAVDAATCGETAIAVGTGEARIDGNLLYTEGETAAYPRAVIIIIRCIHFI